MHYKNVKTDKELEQENPELYYVARQRGTEAPFKGKYVNTKDRGMYTCAVCHQELFSSDTKFDSGTGWPSFDKAIPGRIIQVPDMSHGMQRIEVVCSRCGAHLGHVFDDGPTETGQRYCINSVCLDLEKETEQDKPLGN